MPKWTENGPKIPGINENQQKPTGMTEDRLKSPEMDKNHFKKEKETEALHETKHPEPPTHQNANDTDEATTKTSTHEDTDEATTKQSTRKQQTKHGPTTKQTTHKHQRPTQTHSKQRTYKQRTATTDPPKADASKHRRRPSNAPAVPRGSLWKTDPESPARRPPTTGDPAVTTNATQNPKHSCQTRSGPGRGEHGGLWTRHCSLSGELPAENRPLSCNVVDLIQSQKLDPGPVVGI